jgi:hypothetical protein
VPTIDTTYGTIYLNTLQRLRFCLHAAQEPAFLLRFVDSLRLGWDPNPISCAKTSFADPDQGFLVFFYPWIRYKFFLDPAFSTNISDSLVTILGIKILKFF